ncbi:MAG: 4-hydroxy-tetrahydrodipicolinate reductase [Christensenellaceae bacterium]|jgi:4-hydroxy-tetrahydrodipicolinate reductase
MNRVIITGANGAMGQVLARMIAASPAFEVVAGVDLFADRYENPFPVFSEISACDVPADILIDFSQPGALDGNLAYATEKNLPLIIATTGYNNEQRAEIAATAEKIPVFFTANMSLGVNLQLELCRQAASFFGDSVNIEIIERHHNLKLDSPSGTAIALAEAINEEKHGAMQFQFGRHGLDTKRKENEIGLHSIRGGKIVGEHDVLFITDEELLEIRHRSESKEVFAAGALRAAEFLLTRPIGLYSMHDIVGGVKTVTRVYSEPGEAVITIRDFPGDMTHFAALFAEVANHGVNIDIISQSVPLGGKVNLSFSFAAEDATLVETAVSNTVNTAQYDIQKTLAKVTIEGMGMENSSGVAAKLFTALGEASIALQLITTSETKISFCVEEVDRKKAESIARATFGL